MIRGWYPEARFGHLVDNTGLLLLVVGEFTLSEVVFTDEAASIEDFIVIRAQFRGIGPLDGIDKFALAGVLHEGIRHGRVQCRYKSLTDFLGTSLA